MRSSSGLTTASIARAHALLEQCRAQPVRPRVTLRRQTLLEQLAQVARSGCVRRQHALHVALAEGDAGLQQVAAAGAQHRDLPHAQFRSDQQAVEAVIVEFAGAHRAKGGDQLVGDARHDRRAAAS